MLVVSQGQNSREGQPGHADRLAHFVGQGEALQRHPGLHQLQRGVAAGAKAKKAASVLAVGAFASATQGWQHHGTQTVC
jgi:hypothetical protein